MRPGILAIKKILAIALVYLNGNNRFIAVLGCKRCGKCDNICPNDALFKVDGITRIDYNKCTLCGRCVEICPNKALIYIE